MHDHASSHDIPKDLLIPESRWSSHNNKLGLQNPKSPLNIFPSCRLCIVKDEFFLALGFCNWLDKSTPHKLDAIRKIVHIVICAAICFEGHRWCFFIC